jgi:hypothetical protein
LTAIVLAVVSAVTGMGGGLLLAAVSMPANLPPDTTGGTTGATATQGTPQHYTDGLATGDPNNVPEPEETGISTSITTDQASPELHDHDIDKLITKIRPKATPLDNIMRYCKTVNVSQPEWEFFSLGTRPIKTTVNTAVAGNASTATITLTTDNDNIFEKDDTIWVVGVKGYLSDGANADPMHDLILHVANVDDSGVLKVYAVNGLRDSAGQNTKVPAIAKGKVLVRGGRAAAELDAQTAAFANTPTPQKIFCQIFMMQVEQSTVEKMWKKRVNWDFSDIEEDSIFDMRRGQEASLWFGRGAVVKHPIKKQRTWFCEGIWWQAGKDLYIGSGGVITDDNLVDFERSMFTGDGSGSDRKVLFCGSDLMAALDKIKSDKLRLMKETVEAWNLRFKNFDTDFGEILAIYHPGFDEYDMSYDGFVLDPTLLTRVQYLSFARNVVDFDKLAVRNSQAVIMREALALVLRCPNAHARVHLQTEGAPSGINMNVQNMTVANATINEGA